MTDIVQRVACKAVVAIGGKVLLIREAASHIEGTIEGKYHFPGGRVELGEPFEVALKRELIEEVGLDITIHAPIYVGEWQPVIKGVKNQIIAIYFVCDSAATDVKLSKEYDDYIWIDPANCADLDVVQTDRKVIDTYNQTLLGKK